MSKKTLLWIGVGVAVYFLFIRKAAASGGATPSAMMPPELTSSLPSAVDILGSQAQGIIGELGAQYLGVQQ